MTDLEILDLGGTLFPLPPGDKAPPPSDVTGKGACFKLSTEARRALLAGARDDANLGLLLGHCRVQMPDGSFRGVFAIDEDNKPARVDRSGKSYGAQHGAATLAELERRLCPLPRTLTSITPGAGRHRLYWAPADLVDIPAKVLRRDVSFGADCGVEILTEGRYIVYPGSTLSQDVSEAKGYVAGAYRWEDANAPIADLPAEWINYLLDLNGGAAAAISGESDVDPVPLGEPDSEYARWRIAAAERYLEHANLSIRGNGGRDVMFKIACTLVRTMRLPTDVAAAAIDRVYNPRLLAAGTTAWSVDKPGPNGGCLVERLESARRTATRVPAGLVPSEHVWNDVGGHVAPASVSLVDDTPECRRTVTSAASPLGEIWGGWNKPIDPPVYLLEGLIPEGKVCTFYAEGGSVKSWAAFKLAISVATGEPWLDRSVQRGKALILDYEDGRYEFQRRMRILRGGNFEDLPELGYLYGGPSLDKRALWQTLTPMGLRLLVIDTLGAGMPLDADENLPAFAEAVKLAGRFTECGCTVLIVAHANKSGGLRGTSAIRDQSDVVFKFEPVSETDDVKRMRMVCDKPGPQKKPAPVNLELSDAGLKTFEDEAQATGRNAKTQAEVEAAVRLALGARSMTGIEIEQHLRGDNKRVRDAIKVLRSRGEIFTRGERHGWELDDVEKRQARIRTAADLSRGSAADLADAAFASVDDVREMVRSGALVERVAGRPMGFIPT